MIPKGDWREVGLGLPERHPPVNDMGIHREFRARLPGTNGMRRPAINRFAIA